MSVVDSARDVLNAQPFPTAFKQNLYDVPMVDIVHSAKLRNFFNKKKTSGKSFLQNVTF